MLLIVGQKNQRINKEDIMRQITYKYKVGDTVKFKDKFNKSATSCLKKFAGRTARITEQRDYNGPCYRLEGIEGFFTERCFAGIIGG
jgi:ribosomal protein L21E